MTAKAYEKKGHVFHRSLNACFKVIYERSRIKKTIRQLIGTNKHNRKFNFNKKLNGPKDGETVLFITQEILLKNLITNINLLGKSSLIY